MKLQARVADEEVEVEGGGRRVALSPVSRRERAPAASKSRYLRPLSVTAVKRASRHSI